MKTLLNYILLLFVLLAGWEILATHSMLPAPPCLIKQFSGFKCMACGSGQSFLYFVNGSLQKAFNHHIGGVLYPLIFFFLLSYKIYIYLKSKSIIKYK